jgi:site-specific DNA recombinase
MRLDGYIRVSRVGTRSGESFISPTVQREAIESYARLHGHEIARWWTDLDESGSKLERPEFQKALARCRAGETGGIIAAKLDRLTRSLSGLAQLVDEADAGGWTLIAVDLGLDLKRPGGQLVANVLGSVAQWELAQRRIGWEQAQAKAVEHGIHVASKTPTGYRRRSDRRLEPDPAAAAVVREVFRRRARGDGWTALARFLDESGVRGPYGNNRWTPSAATKMIRNRVYLGEARSGKHVNHSAHAPLVSRAEWEAAQGDRTVASARNGDGLLLQGIVRCAGCRYLLKADTMRGRDGSRLGLYRCRARHAAGQCPAPATIMSRVLDPYIEQAFLSALGPSGPLAEAVASTKALEAAIADVENAEAELVAYRDEPGILTALGRERFLEGLEARAEVVRVAQAKLNEARQQNAMNGHDVVTPGDLVEAWPTLTVAEKRALLTASLDAVMVRSARGSGTTIPVDERTLLLWRGEAPADLPRRGHRVPLESFPWPDKTPAKVRVSRRQNANPSRRKRGAR